MPSQRQIDANRRNAQKSTGPQTHEGRAAVRFNAQLHGLTAKNAVLDNEKEEDFQEMLEAFQAEHQPVGPTENLLVHQMVMAAWRLQRLRGIETGLFNLRMHQLSKLMDLTRDGMEENQRQAFVFFDDSRNACAIQNLVRYETRIERSFYRALHELQRLRAGREPAPHPNEPTPASEPPAPDPADPDPATAQTTPPPAQPAPSTQVTNSAKQSHFQNRTPQDPTVSGKVRLGAEREQIVNLVDDILRQDKRTIVFDVAGVTSIDSTGIGRFIASYNKISAAGGEMRMASATGALLQMSQVCALDKHAGGAGHLPFAFCLLSFAFLAFCLSCLKPCDAGTGLTPTARVGSSSAPRGRQKTGRAKEKQQHHALSSGIFESVGWIPAAP